VVRVKTRPADGNRIRAFRGWLRGVDIPSPRPRTEVTAATTSFQP